MSSDEDLSRVHDRPHVERAQALIDEEAQRIDAAERKRMYKAIRDGTATPEQALLSWQRLEAVESLQQSLRKRQRAAVTASHRAADDL